MAIERCDIAVIGGGVVGAAAALGLAQAGFEVRLVDPQRDAPPPGAEVDPRVYAISPGSAALLDQLGVWKRIAASRSCRYRAMRIWEVEPEQALVFDAAEAGVDQLGWIVEQSVMLAALWAALPDGVLRAGRRLGDAQLPEVDGERALLRLDDGTELAPRLLLSAQGVDGTLRRVAGIASGGRRYGQHALVAHLDCTLPHQGTALQRFLPGGPLALLPLADGRRSLVWSVPSAQQAELLTLQPEAFCQRIAQLMQFQAGAITGSTRPQGFELQLAQAQRYVAPGLALLGDAAHRLHPLAGQGANLGFGDVTELLEVLVGARDAGRDWAGLRALTAWERRRQAASREMVLVTDGLDRLFRSTQPGVRSLRVGGLAVVERLGPLKQLLVRRALQI